MNEFSMNLYKWCKSTEQSYDGGNSFKNSDCNGFICKVKLRLYKGIRMKCDLHFFSFVHRNWEHILPLGKHKTLISY